MIFVGDNGTDRRITSRWEGVDEEGVDIVGGKSRMNTHGTHVPMIAWWPGRVAPEYRGVSLGARLLRGLGRPMIRKLYLGRGPRDEVQQGFQGNTVIMAQPRDTHTSLCAAAHSTQRTRTPRTPLITRR